ncbi:hypothetical protein FFF34_015315 [Inquilinus sp. KBS0705]|nr:hypothetical protein FFF34_015315 [Inquilinus sp. KBS0705]
MLPENLYKRRRAHNNTPQSVLLILTNCIVLAVLIQMFTGCSINNFFWIALGVLALYNAYTIRRNREEYNRLNIIIYIASIVLMAFLFYYFSTHSGNCS